MKKRKFWQEWKKWELALLMALCVTLLFGLWAQSRQKALSDKLIRLHVSAASDSEEDQAAKLRVRDGVLALLAPALEKTRDAEEAARVIEEMLPALRETARSLSGEERVSVTLGMESFPTRQYEGFALPAGLYRSLRVTLGGGGGQNWWCVVFPPLCLQAAEVSAGEVSGLSDDDVRLITEADGGYVLRFRMLEFWGEIMEKLM